MTDKNGFFSTKDRRAAGDLDEDEDADTARVQNPFDDLLEAKDIKTEDLQKRGQQILQGVWFGTGEFGSTAAMNSSFGALPYDSYILEEMPCEANEGYSLQRFYFTVDQKSQNGFVDLETITDDVPEIGTMASVNGIKRDVLPKKEIELTDVIEYKGLKKGETYTAKGKLMDKTTGEVIKDSSGKEITAERPFTAPAAEGRAFVTFKFDGSVLGGKETVVFETLYDAQGHLTAKHEDINDEGQTVTWRKPEIGTTLTDQKNNKSVVTSDKTILVDTVEYKGLDTSQWYMVYGTLMVKDTGDPLVENGTPVAAMSKPFKPLMKNGKVKVEFEISTKGLEGKELVAFETAYRLEGYKKGDDVSKTPGVIVAEHKDLKDKGQTIKVVKPGTPIEHSPKTGDDAQVLVAAALMLAAASFAYALYKRRKTGKEDSEETEE